jgi:hypothetical protein
VDSVIEPGDDLVTHCVYDSRARTTATVGGESSDNEMCLNFMMYEPAQPIDTCW